MTSLEYLTITIPNLSQNTYPTQPIPLNGRLYFFEYYWNIRQNRAYLSIYINQNGEILSILKPTCLIENIILSKYIYDRENWSGELTFAKIIGSNEADYRIDNLHENFILNYQTTEE